VEANVFDGTFGTSIRLQAGDVVVAGNDFRGAPEQGQVDIDVYSGGGHRIGPNHHETGSVRYYVNLQPGSVGELFATTPLLAKVNDRSGGTWTTFVVDARAFLPSSADAGGASPTAFAGDSGLPTRTTFTDRVASTRSSTPEHNGAATVRATTGGCFLVALSAEGKIQQPLPSVPCP